MTHDFFCIQLNAQKHIISIGISDELIREFTVTMIDFQMDSFWPRKNNKRFFWCCLLNSIFKNINLTTNKKFVTDRKKKIKWKEKQSVEIKSVWSSEGLCRVFRFLPNCVSIGMRYRDQWMQFFEIIFYSAWAHFMRVECTDFAQR